MTTAEERMQILKMIQEGKISAEEGAKLLQALGAGFKADKRPPVPPTPGGRDARWFRVRVTALSSGTNKVKVNRPMGLVKAAIKKGERFAPNVENVDYNELMEAIKSGASGKLVDVTDEEDGERVEIFVE